MNDTLIQKVNTYVQRAKNIRLANETVDSIRERNNQ